MSSSLYYHHSFGQKKPKKHMTNMKGDNFVKIVSRVIKPTTMNVIAIKNFKNKSSTLISQVVFEKMT